MILQSSRAARPCAEPPSGAPDQSLGPSPQLLRPRHQPLRNAKTMTDAVTPRIPHTRRASRLPRARSVRWNPAAEELRELTARMPNARHTVFDNYNVQTEVVSRSKSSTFIVSDQ